MANLEHLEILNQGVEAWNRWRNDNPEIFPDLSYSDLSGANLSKADLSKASLSKANLSGVNLFGADLFEADLKDANLFGADLFEANLSGANLSKADLFEANLGGADLRDADLNGAFLSGANLRGKDLRGANLGGADLSNADLSHADLSDVNLRSAKLSFVDLRSRDLRGKDLRGSDLSKASLSDTDLSGSDLRDANLDGADLRDANLDSANFVGADLRDANISGANISGANISGAHLYGVNFSQAFLQDADFTGARFNNTIFANTDLSQVKGLESAQHDGPSTIGIDTLYKSKGQIPEVFLRGCGLSDWEIESTKLYKQDLSQSQVTDIAYKVIELRTNPAIQFNSCFISYSSLDQKFSEKLYADLQENGVRCWFAPENMKIGDRIRDRIDEAIRLQNRLLLVLSASSIKSQWVEQEVETALEIERSEQRTILCPIRLDEVVMSANAAWASFIRKTRHIGDFSGWGAEEAYQEAFSRLLRDLTAEESHNKL